LQDKNPAQTTLLEALKAVDETYTVNEERPFQLRNRNAYEVEILVPPSELDALPKADRIRPAPMDEVEWLLLGPLSAAFVESLPIALLPYYKRWAVERKFAVVANPDPPAIIS